MASDPVEKHEEAVEDDELQKEATTVHHIRANSTIMQVNKILGKPPLVFSSVYFDHDG